MVRAQQLLEEASKANEAQGGDMDTVRTSLQPLYQIVEDCIPVSEWVCYSNVPVCYSHVRRYATAAMEDYSPVGGWCATAECLGEPQPWKSGVPQLNTWCATAMYQGALQPRWRHCCNHATVDFRRVTLCAFSQCTG